MFQSLLLMTKVWSIIISERTPVNELVLQRLEAIEALG